MVPNHSVQSLIMSTVVTAKLQEQFDAGLETRADFIIDQPLEHYGQVDHAVWQQLYARQLGIPWGISEAAHSERDASQTYQYRAFGVPLVSLKGGTGDDLVVAPYATLLALAVDPEGAVGNLREMASRGWIGRYGFFESVDFRRARFSVHNRAVIVRSFMAHHQAMGLLSLCNLLRDNSMQRRFHAETMVAATELLLQERIPALLAGGEDEEVFEAMMRVSTAPSAS